MTRRVVVLDYGSGNLRSAERALARAGADVTVTADLDAAAECDGLVVPGVGAFAACMTGLRGIGGEKVIAEQAGAGPPGPRHLRRHAGPVRGGCRARGPHRRVRGLARHRRAPGRAGAAAHGLEHGGRGAGFGAVRRDSGRHAVLFRALLRAADGRRGPAARGGREDHRGPSTASRSPRPSSRASLPRPSSTRRSPATPARRVLSQLAGGPCELTLILLPAVDVAGGQAVRLVQGAAGTETSYGDPVAAALAWQ